VQIAQWPIFRVMPQVQADRLQGAEREPASTVMNVRERKALVGQIALSEAYERVRAKEQTA